MSNFDSPHIYVQWGGKLPGGEQWSCGVRLAKKTPGAVNDGAALLAGVTAALSAYHSSPNTLISSKAKLSFVKVNSIGVDGRYSAPGTNVSNLADIAGGIGGGTNYPNQVCCVVTLQTGFSRGVAHKGRFYLPLPAGMPVQDDGRCQGPTAASVATQTGVLMDALNTVNADYEMAIFSRGRTVGGVLVSPPAHRRVTQAVVGRVLDTQRRRRRALAEDWQ